MNKDQVIRLLKLGIVVTLILLIFEIIFSIEPVTTFFTNLISGASGFWVYAIIWMIMFLQVTILNIPAYVILVASVGVGIETLSFTYIMVVITAYMAGALLAYAIGRKWGIKAVRWVAGSNEEFEKWSLFLNEKGKWFYFLTILFPLFPDDLLCIVAGSIKLNFWFYTLANLIGRTIGLITMLLVLKGLNTIGGRFPFMILVWAALLVAQIIGYIILKRNIKRR